MICLSTVLHS